MSKSVLTINGKCYPNMGSEGGGGGGAGGRAGSASLSLTLGDLGREHGKFQPWMKTKVCPGFILFLFFMLRKMLDFII